LEIGFQTSLTLISRYGIYKNPQVNQYISQIGEGIVRRFSKRPDLTYRFIILNTPEVNAFAAPGGFIFITKGTLCVMDNEAELIAVLSHEITHVEVGDGLAAIASDPDIKEKLRITAALSRSGKSLSKQYLEELDKEIKNTHNESGNIFNFDVKNEVDTFFKDKTVN
jgi:predicted Zn-dependent protease